VSKFLTELGMLVVVLAFSLKALLKEYRLGLRNHYYRLGLVAFWLLLVSGIVFVGRSFQNPRSQQCRVTSFACDSNWLI